MSLWVCQNRHTSETAHTEGLQLFNLPALRGSLGSLPSRAGSRPWQACRDVIVSLGRSGNPLHAMSTVRLYDPLGGSKESGLRSDGCEYEERRPRYIEGRSDSSS